MALRKKRYVDALIERGRPAFTPRVLRLVLRKISEKLRDANPPSPTTAYRWCRALRDSDDPRKLIPRFDQRGPKKPKTRQDIIDLFMESLVEASNRTKAWTLGDAADKLKEKIDHANQFRASSDQLRAPSIRTLYRLLDRVDEYDVAVLTEGKSRADKRYRVTRRGERTTHILQRVEVDHTPLDLFLIDEQTGIPCGRPTLTMLIDQYSRMPLGYYVSFNDTSTLAVMRALRHAILPKKPVTAAVPNLVVKHSWPCYGRFDCLVADNGAEFHSDSLEAACFDLKIRMLFCPARQPRFKGTIERFLKTCNYNFAHKLPGTSLARWTDRGDYDPLKTAVLTIAEFTHVFEKWLLDVYAQTIHRGIRTTPWNLWHKSAANYVIKLPTSASEIAMHLGVEKTRSVRHDGIRLHNLQYVSADLLPIMQTYGEGVRVRVNYDPDDIGNIWIWAPDSQNRIEVPALHAEYADGLRLAQHELIQRYLREQERSDESPDELLKARLEIANAMKSEAFDQRLRVRRRAMKKAGVSNEMPTGSGPKVTEPTPRTVTPHHDEPIAAQRYDRRQRSST
jgi:putative transposase